MADEAIVAEVNFSDSCVFDGHGVLVGLDILAILESSKEWMLRSRCSPGLAAGNDLLILRSPRDGTHLPISQIWEMETLVRKRLTARSLSSGGFSACRARRGWVWVVDVPFVFGCKIPPFLAWKVSTRLSYIFTLEPLLAIIRARS
jgi:hypothetical protein